MAGKSWQLEGKYVEYCSCDQGCPCETMADPTYGSCTGLVAFKIDKGYCEDVQLDDLVVAGTFYFPRAIHHGQGVMQAILDERADETQRNALFYILSGEDQPVGTMFQIFSVIIETARARVETRLARFLWSLKMSDRLRCVPNGYGHHGRMGTAGALASRRNTSGGRSARSYEIAQTT